MKKKLEIGDSGTITDKKSIFVGKMGTIMGISGNMLEVRVGERTVLVKKGGIDIVSDEYAKGGGVEEYKIKENGKTISLFTIDKIKGDRITVYKGIDADGKEHFFDISQYIEKSFKKHAKGGSIGSSFEYSIGGL